MKKIKKTIQPLTMKIGIIVLASISLFHLSHAQDEAKPNTHAFSLEQSIVYALEHSIIIKNADIDAQVANARVKEIMAIGFPQINAEANLIHNIDIQKVILENGPSSPFNNPAAPAGSVVAFPFQLQNLGSVTVTGSQLIFNGSYLVGLKAARTMKELTVKTSQQTRVNIIESVSKAYYFVLVNEAKYTLLHINVQRLDSIYKQTSALYHNGFVEKIDADRLEVQLNNLKNEEQKVRRLVDLTYSLLKFQMGMSIEEPIILTDSLSSIKLNLTTADIPQEKFNYTQRIDYSILQTQRELAKLDVRNNQASFFPQLAAFGTYGFNPAASQFENLFDFTNRWFAYSLVGLQLKIPILDGSQRAFKLRQAKLTYKKANQSFALLENSIDLQVQQAQIMMKNSIETLQFQEKNMALATEVARVTQIKYQQGVGSNIEVINAEASLKEAQTNYYAALYDALVARIDLDKALGLLDK